MEYEMECLPDGSAVCGNCGKPIPPNSQVAVAISGRKAVVFHSEYSCSPAGNARYGFWGKGKLESVFGEIEQC